MTSLPLPRQTYSIPNLRSDCRSMPLRPYRICNFYASTLFGLGGISRCEGERCEFLASRYSIDKRISMHFRVNFVENHQKTRVNSMFYSFPNERLTYINFYRWSRKQIYFDKVVLALILNILTRARASLPPKGLRSCDFHSPNIHVGSPVYSFSLVPCWSTSN